MANKADRVFTKVCKNNCLEGCKGADSYKAKPEIKNVRKKVHFPPDNELVSIKKMVVWSYAMKAARVGRWEECARDTMRFNDRICRVRSKLELVLEPRHRERIWKERFASDYQ